MLDTMTLKNMSTKNMKELIYTLEKEVKFRESIGEEIEENQKKMNAEVPIHQEYIKNREDCLAAFIKWRSSFAAVPKPPKKEIKTRNYLEGPDKPFE